LEEEDDYYSESSGESSWQGDESSLQESIWHDLYNNDVTIECCQTDCDLLDVCKWECAQISSKIRRLLLVHQYIGSEDDEIDVSDVVQLVLNQSGIVKRLLSVLYDGEISSTSFSSSSSSSSNQKKDLLSPEMMKDWIYLLLTMASHNLSPTAFFDEMNNKDSDLSAVRSHFSSDFKLEDFIQICNGFSKRTDGADGFFIPDMKFKELLDASTEFFCSITCSKKMRLCLDDDLASNRSKELQRNHGVRSVYVPRKRTGTHISRLNTVGTNIPLGMSVTFKIEPLLSDPDAKSCLKTFKACLISRGYMVDTGGELKLDSSSDITITLDRGYSSTSTLTDLINEGFVVTSTCKASDFPSPVIEKKGMDLSVWKQATMGGNEVYALAKREKNKVVLMITNMEKPDTLEVIHDSKGKCEITTSLPSSSSTINLEANSGDDIVLTLDKIFHILKKK
jgi:hypothetical protein